jgi:hypothetical protein
MSFAADVRVCAELLRAVWANCSHLLRILGYPQFLSTETI